MVSLKELERLRREVEELETKRIKQCIALRLRDRCRLIATKLGNPKQDMLGTVYEFEGDGLHIKYVFYNDMIRVKYRGAEVLDIVQDTLFSYRPGKWLGKVIELSRKLLDEEIRMEYELLLGKKKNWEVIEE